MPKEPRAQFHASDISRSEPKPSTLSRRSRSQPFKSTPVKLVKDFRQHDDFDESEIERDVHTGALWIVRHANALLHRPYSDETELSTQLAHSFENLDLQRAWFAYVPCYVGAHKGVDSAAKAVILAWRNRTNLPVAGMRHYAQAIQELRISLDSSDLSLLCVALMANFETVATAAVNPMYTHGEGLVAIIKARPKGFNTSEVARAVLYTFSDELFRLAVRNNTPHPLDNPQHRNMEPPSPTTSRDEAVLSLRRTGFRLFVRLPRLISTFRAWRAQIENGEMVHVPESLLLLARELLDSRNCEAEDQLLHRVGVLQTRDASTRKLMPYSFAFNYLSEVEAIGLYWEARVITVSICIRMCILEDSVQFGLGSTPRADFGSSVDFSKAKDEKQSSLSNIMMSWQYTLTTPILSKDAIQALLIM